MSCRLQLSAGLTCVFRVNRTGTMAPAGVVKPGENVILKKGKSLRLYQVFRKRKVQLDKKHFYLDEVIGKPYGLTWDVRGHNVHLVSQHSGPEEDSAQAGGTDNRSLVDDRSAQKLSDVDIHDLKIKGQHGEAIVEQLVENSASFKEKTIYSQAKYLKRKREKHVMQFQILRPTTLLLCEMYGMRAPSKNIYLRMDTLAQILGGANIQSGLKVLVMETCQGLLLGAIMERMGGKGTIVQIHSEHVPVRLAVEAYNFPASFMDTLHSYPADQLHQFTASESVEGDSCPGDKTSAESSRPPPTEDSGTGPSDRGGDLSKSGQTETAVSSLCIHNREDSGPSSESHSKAAPMGNGKGDDQEVPGVAGCHEDAVAMETDRPSDEAAEKREYPVNPEKEARKERKRQTLSRVRDLLQSTEMDALVMACKFQPFPIFEILFRFLAPSRPFVVYCHYIEPLMICNDWLRDSGEAVNLRVTETWFREYQVLPERTHPVVNMSGTGGYLLTGIKVSNGISR